MQLSPIFVRQCKIVEPVTYTLYIDANIYHDTIGLIGPHLPSLHRETTELSLKDTI